MGIIEEMNQMMREKPLPEGWDAQMVSNGPDGVVLRRRVDGRQVRHAVGPLCYDWWCAHNLAVIEDDEHPVSVEDWNRYIKRTRGPASATKPKDWNHYRRFWD